MSSTLPSSDLRPPTSSRGSDTEVLVRVEGVSKIFCRDLKKSLWYGLKDSAHDLLSWGKKSDGRDQRSEIGDQRSGPSDNSFSSPTSDLRPLTSDSSSSLTSDLRPPTSEPALRAGEFFAVRDVSFTLRRGECLGLIGRNGAGKTTLLKILNGLIKPDAGRIEMRGRVGALIALGAGFNPILTGRENIYVNGSVLGLTKKEIDAKIVEIIDFAEIGEFIESPVQSYSSGMQVRLGFAVATAMDPDVLILDEVLAVGDAAFRNKCYRRIMALRKQAAVIFVSHQMEQVGRISNYVLMLSQGAVEYIGDVPNGVHAYESANEDESEGDDAFLSCAHPISSFTLADFPSTVDSWGSCSIEMVLQLSEKLGKYGVRVIFYNSSGCFAADGNLDIDGGSLAMSTGINRIMVCLPAIPLKAGIYQLAINIIDQHGDLIVWSYKQYSLRIANAHHSAISDCQIQFQATKLQ